MIVRRFRIAHDLRIAAFVFLSAVIVVMASERVYWYWAGLSGESVLVLGAFYAVPMMVAIWLLGSVPGGRMHQIVLAASAFAFIVEGVLTPVIYEDGLLPLLAAMFVGWHGLVSLVGFWYLTRKWLLERRLLRLMSLGAGFGLFWGVWALVSSVSTLVDPADVAALVDDGASVALLTPSEFAGYAIGVGVILAMAHWLIGFVWPDSWRPSRRSAWWVAGIAVAYLSVAVIPVVPWAPIKLGGLMGLVWWLSRRSRAEAHREPNAIDRLVGRVRLRDTAVLLVLPVSAALVYRVVWSARTSDLSSLGVVLVVAQVLSGAVAFGWAAVQAVRREAVSIDR